MSLFVYNSLTRNTEEFVPADPKAVTLYVCGPTVYDTPHIGNARPAVVFDLLFRVLRHLYGERSVVYARNFTDIDDKIMARAAERDVPIEVLTEGTIAEYIEIVQALGCLSPTFAPRATQAIPDIVEMVERLIANRHAYVAEGHVLFDVASDPDHGTLSRHDQEDLRAGSRVEPASYKREPADFVLWKPSSADQPGWDSPWGRGRPGWHIECSAMIRAILGPTIDIHGGGGDLRFPHHECEISQSRCANEAPLARYFMHNGMVLSEGRKFAKSTGTGVTPRELMDRGVQGESIRLALLGAHYRQPLDWTADTIGRAEIALGRWRNALLPFKGRVAPECTDAAHGVLEALQGDLNTPQAIAEMHDLARRVSSTRNEHVVAGMMWACTTLGVLDDMSRPLSEAFLEIQALVDRRTHARASRDFALADNLRVEIEGMGVRIRDDAGETHWWEA